MPPDIADARWMRMALGLARRGLGRVAPNPAVAALVVKDGRLLGRGVTAPGGRPHAEVRALAEVAALHGEDAARGATAYVTLEPCAHQGRTPPCAAALSEAGIARLVCPVTDPDPRVSGRGFDHLRAAGIEVSTGLLAEEARALNAGFLSRIERGRPRTLLKLAASLDGRIATASGESRWITGEAARRRVHLMRAEADAVMVGSGTAAADDPMLDVRGFGEGVVQPVRIVTDTALRLSPESRLAASARTQALWLAHGREADTARAATLAETGARLLPVAEGVGGGLDLHDLMGLLAREGLTRVLCEGGAGLAAGLLGAGLVDELALFTAGIAIGGDGRASACALGLERLADAPRMRLVSVERAGGDTLSRWVPEA